MKQAESGGLRRSPEYCDFLLLKVPAIFFINKHQIQIIFHTEFVVDIAVCWCEFIWAQEQPDWNRLT